MTSIERVNGQRIVNYMARDFDSLLGSMRDLIPEMLPEWTDFESEADFGNALLQLFAHMGDILSYYQDRVANESFLGTARSRRSIIHHLRLIGYQLTTAAPASTKLTLYIPGDCDETITIRKGDAFATKSGKDNPSVRFEYTAEDDLTIDCDQLEPVSGTKTYEGVPVEEGQLVRDEFLGTSDGSRNQRFPLAHASLILRSVGRGQSITRDIVLRSELGTDKQEWSLVESLAFSREDQLDYSVEIDENDRATIQFGDGGFGRIPPTGSAIYATYRVGGGTHGNVTARTIQTIVDAPQLSILGVKVENEEPATGGAERESIEHAVGHAPSVFRSLKRAVTAADYEALAGDFAGVGKVRAESTNWNTVELFVAPEGGGQVSDVLEANLKAYFEDLRPLSTIIEVKDVDYVEVFVTAQVDVESYYSQTQIAEEVKNTAGELLSFGKVEFGKPVFMSKFYEAIEAIDGVASVNISEFRRQTTDGAIEPSGKIKIEAYELAVGAEEYDDLIKVEATGGF